MFAALTNELLQDAIGPSRLKISIKDETDCGCYAPDTGLGRCVDRFLGGKRVAGSCPLF